MDLKDEVFVIKCTVITYYCYVGYIYELVHNIYLKLQFRLREKRNSFNSHYSCISSCVSYMAYLQSYAKHIAHVLLGLNIISHVSFYCDEIRARRFLLNSNCDFERNVILSILIIHAFQLAYLTCRIFNYIQSILLMFFLASTLFRTFRFIVTR